VGLLRASCDIGHPGPPVIEAGLFVICPATSQTFVIRFDVHRHRAPRPRVILQHLRCAARSLRMRPATRPDLPGGVWAILRDRAAWVSCGYYSAGLWVLSARRFVGIMWVLSFPAIRSPAALAFFNPLAPGKSFFDPRSGPLWVFVGIIVGTLSRHNSPYSALYREKHTTPEKAKNPCKYKGFSWFKVERETGVEPATSSLGS
jgi:hypothetical protein